MTLTIRPRQDEDLPDLAAVLVRVHAQDDYPVEGVANLKAGYATPTSCRAGPQPKDGKPIGQIALTRATPDDDAARVWRKHTTGDVDHLAIPVRLFVDPDHRGSGSERLLMDAALDLARSQRLSIVFDVMLKDHAAIRLYERLGAQRVAHLTHQYGDGLAESAAVFTLP